MTADSTLAKEFLLELEAQSFNFIERGWQELPEMEVIDKACFTFHVLSNEMDRAAQMAIANAIQ